MDILESVKQHFNDSLQAKTQTMEALTLPIANAGSLIAQALLEGHKILTCGNGGSSTLATHFVTCMLNHYAVERPSLPAFALSPDAATLTAIANDYNFMEVFAKQIRALGNQGDILLAISASGNSTNVLRAIEAAHDRKMPVIALTGHEGGDLASLLHPEDIELRVALSHVPRIQETHLLILHCLCDLIDHQLFAYHVGE